ncbi:MAG: zinc finger Ran-binding domain-containing protein [Oscillospiraceae bacterium]|nr:zinc finger Ran-binding domain-containing protein [Oscillospiraceae bacterium]
MEEDKDFQQVCPKCGKRNSPKALTCVDCGHYLQKPPPSEHTAAPASPATASPKETPQSNGSQADASQSAPPDAPDAFAIDGVSSELIAAMVRSEYHVEKFRKLSRRRVKLSFNGATLAAIPWFYTHKMYKEAILLTLLITFCMGLFFAMGITYNSLPWIAASLFAVIFIIAAVSFFAEYLYMRFILKNAKRIIRTSIDKKTELHAGEDFMGSKTLNFCAGYLFTYFFEVCYLRA